MIRAVIVILVTLCTSAACSRRTTSPSPCLRSHGVLCLIARIPGEARDGELGFRFDAPRDVDGDGVPDVAAGARFTRPAENPTSLSGTASVWSGSTGQRLAHWAGSIPDGLFGHSAMLTPDLDGDGLADLVVAAPTGQDQSGTPRGVVVARSPRTSRTLWTRAGEPGDAFGWHLAVTSDHDGDGVVDLFISAPGGHVGVVHLVSGRDGSSIRSYASQRTGDSFGWYVSPLPDIDGDGRDDLVIGAPLAKQGGEASGAAAILSSATGQVVREWTGQTELGELGEMVLGLPDLDGDRVPDVAIAAPHARARAGAIEGEVHVHSGATGAVIHHLRGRQEHELFGRMLARAGDVDGDGVEDIAIAAPWHQAQGMERAGRMEIRSGRTAAILAELTGDAPQRWLGWHMAAAASLGPRKEPGLIISLVRSEEGGQPGAGALEVYVYRN